MFGQPNGVTRGGHIDLKTLEETPPSKETDKPLLPAAIKAVANIHPQEAGVVLIEMTDSDDEDIVEAAYETMAMAEVLSGEPFD